MKPRHPAPLNALRAFEAAARQLSFQQAAAELFVTPAAVSHQVKRLEAYLGTPLFIRTHRAVELTPAGAALADALRSLFSQLEMTLDQVASPGAAGLRVSTMESFAAKWLAPRLFRFHRQHPDIRLRIETRDERVDFARDGIDIAIRYGAGRYSGVEVEHLLEAPAFPVCSPALLTGRRPLAKVQDLARHTLLHDDTASGRSNVPDWAAWLRLHGAGHVDPGEGPWFPSLYLAQEAAVAGHGVALALQPLAEEDLRSGRLVRPFEGSVENAYAFWLVRQKGDRRRAVQAFCTWLRQEALAMRG